MSDENERRQRLISSLKKAKVIVDTWPKERKSWLRHAYSPIMSKDQESDVDQDHEFDATDEEMEEEGDG